MIWIDAAMRRLESHQLDALRDMANRRWARAMKPRQRYDWQAKQWRML